MQFSLRVVFTYFAIALSVLAYAQKKRVGSINADSLMSTLPGYKEQKDSSAIEGNRFFQRVKELTIARDKKAKEVDSLKYERQRLTILVKAQEELDQMELALSNYSDSMRREITAHDAQRFAPFKEQLRRASHVVGQQKNCEVRDKNYISQNWKRDWIELIDVNAEVAAELKKPTAKLVLVRVGTFNEDSVLMLIPGYKEDRDSLTLYKQQAQATLAGMEAEYNAKKRELDSLVERDKVTPLMKQLREKQLTDMLQNRRDYKKMEEHNLEIMEIAFQMKYHEKIRNAKDTAGLKNNCLEVHDKTTVNSEWHAGEAIFIDVTADVVKALGL